MFKNIIFNWSGVIKDAKEQHFWTVQKMFEKMGVMNVPIKELEEGWEEPYMTFYNKQGDVSMTNSVDIIANSIWLIHISSWSIYAKNRHSI
jgi:hypothetical protein